MLLSLQESHSCSFLDSLWRLSLLSLTRRIRGNTLGISVTAARISGNKYPTRGLGAAVTQSLQLNSSILSSSSSWDRPVLSNVEEESSRECMMIMQAVQNEGRGCTSSLSLSWMFHARIHAKAQGLIHPPPIYKRRISDHKNTIIINLLGHLSFSTEWWWWRWRWWWW